VRSAWSLAAAVAVAVAIAAGLWVRASRDTPAPRAVLSIAVLPFVDMSENRDQAYLADGIAEEVLNHLAQLSDLRVIARTSSFSLRNQPVSVQEIARRLDITHVLEGSVRKSGDRVRVTAQLIEASDGAHLWSETYERTLVDVFAIQDEIAIGVASALKATLRFDSPGQESPPNMDAYEHVLQGEHFYFRRGTGDAERSVEQFQRALEIDPDYARAWAGLSAAYSLLAWKTDPPSKEIQARQRDAALRAVELNPGLAIAHQRLADYYDETGDDENKRKHYELALKLAPDDAMSLGHRAAGFMESGEYGAAIAIQKVLVARDPLNSVYRQLLNVSLMADGRFEEALSSYETMADLNLNVSPDWTIEIPRILALLGRYEEAVPAALRLPPGKYRDQAMSLMFRASGHHDEAAAALARLEAYVPAPPLEGPQDRIMDAVRLAETYAFTGRTDTAFETLASKRGELTRRADPDHYIRYLSYESRLSPFLKPLHDDPRWAELVAEKE
jgi:TolB-like protein/Flp pilus assembly protein TadD